MKRKDIKGLFRTSLIEIDSIDNPHGDYHVVTLSVDKDTSWEAGEHAIFSLPGKDIPGKKRRVFSVASASSEGKLVLGFKTGEEVSSFKKELMAMKKGDKVKMRGPFGWFKVKEDTTSVVFIATGVGITPIRGLLKELEHQTQKEIHVIYVSSEYHLFGDEISEIANNNKHITLHKVFGKEEAEKTIAKIAKEHTESSYFISGSPHIVDTTKKNLVRYGILNKNIVSDAFYGY